MLISSATIPVGLKWKPPHTDEHKFLAALPEEQPRFVAITSEFIQNQTLFSRVRELVPQARLVLCVLPETVAQTKHLWEQVETLDIDILCHIHELTDCLSALNADQFYVSTLMATHPSYRHAEELIGWHTITLAEKRILRLMLQGANGPTIAKALFLSLSTIDNHKTSIIQKLGITGGQGSLMAFVIQNRSLLERLLNV